MSNAADLMTLLARQRVLPILRTASVEDAVATARVCGQEGMEAVELTTTVPDVLVAARTLADEGLTVGIGTLRSAAELASVAEAGARFAVSYFIPDQFISESIALGLLPVPGVLTPNEVQRAVSAGARVVKVFPAWQSDPRLIGDLEPLVRDVHYIATGGLTQQTSAEWLAAGALAVGTGRALGTVATVGEDALRRNIRQTLSDAGAGMEGQSG